MGFMKDVAGSVAGAAISTAGSIFNSKQNNANARQMAATSVQTRVKDLRAAGLNPILAATHGSIQAAQVPQQQSPDLSSIARVFEQGTGRMNANSARQQADTQSKAVESTIALQGAQSAKTLADTKVALGQAEVQKSQQHLLDEQALTQGALRSNYAANTGLASANAIRANYQAVQDKVTADYLKTDSGKMATEDAYNQKGGKLFGSVNSISNRVGYIRDALSGAVTPAISNSAKAFGKTITIPKVKYNPNDIKRPY
ncbi:hypothetical protein PY36_000881 [Salmonella enterica subsp. enterica]|nr:hypothetical protein [Salmonella enterica subsp. enterica serovar Agbeni]